jgi:23S rRNA pseudouridine2605 synthase
LNERLQKVIARSGLCSRRNAELLIGERRVVVDGTIAHLGQKIDPEIERIEVDGVALPVAPGLVYFLLNKPQGVISTAEDTHARQTVVDLVPRETRVFPVGRLDQDSEGLILLTNDGDLAQHITHPSNQVTKTYAALIQGLPKPGQVRSLADGIELDDGLARAISARIVDSSGGNTMIEIVMGEGRNREVRRMCEAIGFPVVRLFRTAIGPLKDGNLKSGGWRSLSIDEIRSLYAAGSP